MTNNLLNIKNLTTQFSSSKGNLTVVNDVSFHVDRGETVCIVGESGCGKSMTILSLMNLLPNNGEIIDGLVEFQGKDLTKLSQKEMTKIRGKDIAMIFQEPMTALNPVFTIGFQLMESILTHNKMSKSKAFDYGVTLLDQVGIPSPKDRMKQYPHELSGGMRQRIMIAMALSCRPALLLADEPTTALDVTIQAQILDLIQELKEELNMGLLLITHDMGVVAEIADRVIIMYSGKVIEEGTVSEVFNNPKHPYTVGLLNSSPDVDDPNFKLEPIPGSLPNIDEKIAGCRFHPRCKHAMDICKEQVPNSRSFSSQHRVDCWLHEEDTQMTSSAQ